MTAAVWLLAGLWAGNRLVRACRWWAAHVPSHNCEEIEL